MTRTFVNGAVHIRRRQCSSCIYGPRSPVDAERRDGMEAGADAANSCIPCHSHLYRGEAVEPVCRGYYEHGQSVALRLAEALDMVTWVDEP